MPTKDQMPLLKVKNLSKFFGSHIGCYDINFELSKGEIIGIVGESGAGKSTLINCIGGRTAPTNGAVLFNSSQGVVDLCRSDEAVLRKIVRTQTGFVSRYSERGIRMDISAGGNIGQRLMANGMKNYSQIRKIAAEWLKKVEIDPSRIDDFPETFSSGMRQRLQLAANLVSEPRIILMDEPTESLDGPVQARLIDIISRLIHQMNLSMVLATNDLSAARRLCHRLYVMKDGKVIEHGISDQVLDDPREAYTQLMVASAQKM